MVIRFSRRSLRTQLFSSWDPIRNSSIPRHSYLRSIPGMLILKRLTSGRFLEFAANAVQPYNRDHHGFAALLDLLAGPCGGRPSLTTRPWLAICLVSIMPKLGLGISLTHGRMPALHVKTACGEDAFLTRAPAKRRLTKFFLKRSRNFLVYREIYCCRNRDFDIAASIALSLSQEPRG